MCATFDHVRCFRDAATKRMRIPFRQEAAADESVNRALSRIRIVNKSWHRLTNRRDSSAGDAAFAQSKSKK